MTSWGPKRESEAAAHLLNNFKENMLSIVSDSYDLFNFVENIIGEELKWALIYLLINT